MNRKKDLDSIDLVAPRYLWDISSYGTASPTLLRGGGRRTECPSGGHTLASVTAPSEQAEVGAAKSDRKTTTNGR
jgi:hypothetical protein